MRCPQASRCGTPWLALLQFLLTHFIISIAVLEMPPGAGLQKRATFSTLNVGLAGTGNRTWATCVASSGTNRSAIYYALFCRLSYCIFVNKFEGRFFTHSTVRWHLQTNFTFEYDIPQICSAHFVGGISSPTRLHPSYIPTIFPKRTELKQSAKRKFVAGAYVNDFLTY
jgi:hypothetical protein